MTPPKARGVAWTEERGTSDEGRRRLKSAPEAESKHSKHGLVIVDKPGGMTSHDVVARIRRLAGTRRVGHAGTLDPMATGVLVVGVEKATRLLGYLTATEKEYHATIRLGQSTSTDDAEGELTGGAPAGGVSAETLPRPRPASPGRSCRCRPPSARSRSPASGPTS